MRRSVRLACVTLAALGLAACGGGGGDSSSEDGISVVIDVQHRQFDAATAQASELPAGSKTLLNSEGVSITLDLAYLNIWSLELVTDCSGASFSYDSGHRRGLISAAYAHADEAPNRISVPSVLSLLPADQTLMDLGRMQPPPGDYCGVIIDLQAADADTRYLPAPVDMQGRSLYLSGSYQAPGMAQPQAFEFSTGQRLLSRQMLFDLPLRLNAGQRQGWLLLAFEYDRWFDGVDLANLADPTQATLLAQNIAAAIRRVE